VLEKYSIRLRVDHTIWSRSKILSPVSRIVASMKLDVSGNRWAIPTSQLSWWVMEEYDNWRHLAVARITLEALPVKLNNYCTVYYCRLIYEPCLHKWARFFVSTATSRNCSASIEISLSYQAVYQYLLDNPVSGPSFVPTVIAALHPSNTAIQLTAVVTDRFRKVSSFRECYLICRFYTNQWILGTKISRLRHWMW